MLCVAVARKQAYLIAHVPVTCQAALHCFRSPYTLWMVPVGESCHGCTTNIQMPAEACGPAPHHHTPAPRRRRHYRVHGEGVLPCCFGCLCGGQTCAAQSACSSACSSWISTLAATQRQSPCRHPYATAPCSRRCFSRPAAGTSQTFQPSRCEWYCVTSSFAGHDPPFLECACGSPAGTSTREWTPHFRMGRGATTVHCSFAQVSTAASLPAVTAIAEGLTAHSVILTVCHRNIDIDTAQCPFNPPAPRGTLS